MSKGVIGILTGGGDVPGLNPAIRAVTIRANNEGYDVIGIRRGWQGLVDVVPGGDNSDFCQSLNEQLVNKVGRTGGSFLHSSRTRPSHVPLRQVPPHLAGKYTDEVNDLTPEVLKNLETLGIEYLIPIGGDDTLSYGVRLHQEGVKVVGIPKTMDNDVPGTDYCIGFSTCVTRTIALTHALRTSAGSHERFLVIEVFGRYAGFTAMLPTMAGAADRCVIPECAFDIERLCDALIFSKPGCFEPALDALVALSKRSFLHSVHRSVLRFHRLQHGPTFIDQLIELHILFAHLANLVDDVDQCPIEFLDRLALSHFFLFKFLKRLLQIIGARDIFGVRKFLMSI